MTKATRRKRTAAVLAVVVLSSLVLSPLARAQIAPAPARAIKPALACQSDSSAEADFDGDDADDIAIAAPFDDLFENQDLGSINVVYGASDGGADSLGDGYFTPVSSGMPRFKWVLGPGRLFGKAMAAGDFNKDGFSDLAVGMPGAPANDVAQSGAVFVLYGTEDGLSTRHSQAFYQGRGLPAANERGDSYGWSLASGDFNGDAVHDLAVAGPGEDIGSTRDAGAVIVLSGVSGSRPNGGGLSASASVRPKTLVQGRDGLIDASEPGDMFGLALAAGNFDGDSDAGNPIDDLAVGVPHEDVRTRADAGGVQVVYASTAGLTADDQYFFQGAPGVQGADETGDLYGCALAAGNFSGRRFGSAPALIDVDSLAIGVPGEDAQRTNQGGVNVIYAASDGSGLNPSAGPGNQYFIEVPGLADLEQLPETNARFGQALNAQNIDPVEDEGPPIVLDPAWELVIGVPGAAGAAGEIWVIGGVRGDGLRDLADNSYLLSQNTAGTHRASEPGDEFGGSLAFGDYDEDGDSDLVVGAPRESSCGEINETGELISIGPGIPLQIGAVTRAGAGLALHNDGSQIGANSGDLLHLTPPGLGNWSLTRCDYLVEQTEIYGLKGSPQANAEFSHTVAGS